METKQGFEPNILQRLLLKRKEVTTGRLEAFYKKMSEDKAFLSRFDAKGKTPARFVSDYIDVATYATDFDTKGKKYTIEHEFVDKDGKKCKLVLEQGTLCDYELCYPATKYTIYRDGNIVKASTVAANFFRGTELVPMMEYARIMYGEETYGYIMELLSKKMETLDDIPCDPAYDIPLEKNKSKVNRFLSTDKIARQVMKEYKALIKEKEAYDRYQKNTDIANDNYKKDFETYVVQPKNSEGNVVTLYKDERREEKERIR